jgi:hypothetical protein
MFRFILGVALIAGLVALGVRFVVERRADEDDKTTVEVDVGGAGGSGGGEIPVGPYPIN